MIKVIVVSTGKCKMCTIVLSSKCVKVLELGYTGVLIYWTWIFWTCWFYWVNLLALPTKYFCNAFANCLCGPEFSWHFWTYAQVMCTVGTNHPRFHGPSRFQIRKRFVQSVLITLDFMHFKICYTYKHYLATYIHYGLQITCTVECRCVALEKCKKQSH